MSILGIAEDKFGILFYKGGCNRGVIKYLELQKKKGVNSTHYGLRYWMWKLMRWVLDFQTLDIDDFAVLLPKRGKKIGRRDNPGGNI